MEAIITRGYPACGKTTFAVKWVSQQPEHRVNVNRDDIREMLTGDRKNFGMEQTVSEVCDTVIRSAAALGKSIVVSNTNLRERNTKQLIRTLHASGYQTIRFQDFPHTPELCVQRDLQRPAKHQVGEHVIRDLATRFPVRQWRKPELIIADALGNANRYEPIAQNPKLPETWVFDIDGTLAAMGDRSPYQWDMVGVDTPNENIVQLAIMAKQQGKRVVVSSGRSEVCKPETAQWLRQHGVVCDELLMRAESDTRRDSDVKYDFAKQITSVGFVTHWFDDRNQVVDMLRTVFEQPTICLQVNYGDF